MAALWPVKDLPRLLCEVPLIGVVHRGDPILRGALADAIASVGRLHVLTQQHSQQLGCLHDSFVLLAVGLELRAHPASQFQQALAVGDQPREESSSRALIIPIHSLAALDGRLAVAG